MPATSHYNLAFDADADALMTYVAAGGRCHPIAPPVFEIDGVAVPGIVAGGLATGGEPRTVFPGVTEHRLTGPLAARPEVTLELVVRTAQASPVVRFRYELRAPASPRLTKPRSPTGRREDCMDYLGLQLPAAARVKEVRFSEFRESVHAFCLDERDLDQRHFDNRLAVMGPMLVAGDPGGHAMLVAYEHGSQVPDAFLQFHLDPDRRIRLAAARGNYPHGRPVDGFQTIWFEFASVDGDEDDLAAAYRQFVLHHLCPHVESRRPYIFYNTWNHQERTRHWRGGAYLDPMHQDRILAEIDVAHRMGIEVFVLDTGWYEKTGDWRVNRRRFPDGLKAVKSRLDGYGMKLGLWFDHAAGITSTMLARHRDCVISQGGHENEPRPVWETEPAHRMCLVSRYGDALADEWIRLAREVGVRYFKWDAIGQYGCDAARHGHGAKENAADERADCYAFEMGRAMIRTVERLCAAVPDAIVDFDITEGGRFVGLGFLAAGKYYLVNNGPYYRNLDIPHEGGRLFGDRPTWSNVFVYPGPARARICRQPLSFDKWVPSVLFLTHYLPDDPEPSQWINLASLVLGQNGIWGDLLSLSEEGVQRFGRVLGLYRQVRDDITEASPVRSGEVGGSPEVHEKINPATGRGVICLFASAPGTCTYVSRRAVDRSSWCTPGVEVATDPSGRAIITAGFDGPGAHIVMFGVKA